MQNVTLARRYAAALFSLAQEKGALDRVERDLQLVLETVRRERAAAALMEDRVMNPGAKADALVRLFGPHVSPITANFLGVLAHRRREFQLEQIYREFVALANAARGIVEVEVRSAVPLRQEQLNALAARLGRRLGKTVRMRAAVDPGLMGGVVVQVEDLLLDGSLRTRLQRLRERLARAGLPS